MNEFANSAVSYYRHSGRAPILGLALIGIAGFIATPILGVIYGYLSYYIPFVYLNTVLAIAYPWLVGIIVMMAAKYGKVRNALLIGLAGLFFGLFAEYVGWIGWLAAYGGDPELLIKFFFPWELLTIIPFLAERGVWSLNGTTPTGIFLYLIWLAEALTVIGVTIYAALTFVKDCPYCEESSSWAEKKISLGYFAPIRNASEFKASLSQRGISAFEALQPAQPGNAFTRLEIQECGDCNNFKVLNVKKVKVTMNRGRKQVNESLLMPKIILSPSALGSLQRMIEKQTVTQPQ